MKLSTVSFALVLGTAGAFAACGSSGHPSDIESTGGNTFDGSVSSDAGGIINPPPLNGDGSTSPTGPIVVSPATKTLTVVTGSPVPTQQFTATEGGEPANGVKWSIDQGQLGTIDSTGTFTPSGTAGGTGTITASIGTVSGTATITVVVQTTNNGDPSWTATPADAGAGGYGGVGGDGPGAPPTPVQIGVLNGTPSADTSVSFLYPYDGTVWPQGLLAPLLQWNPGAHSFDSVYVHIKENAFEYKGYFATNTTGTFDNVPIPQAAWSTMAFSNQGTGDPVTVTLVFAQGANAYGPYTETWNVAQATLQGTIYYNSYGTELVKNSDGLDSYNQQYGAGTLEILPGATAPTLVAGITSLGASGNGTGCRVCHTVAANGQTLVTQASNVNASDYSTTKIIDLAADTTGGAGADAGTNLTFPALYKDGSMLLSGNGGFGYPNSSETTSTLYALPAGTPIAATAGLPTSFQAELPAFSPDGAHVSFNFWAGTGPDGGAVPTADGGAITADEVSLAMMDFDGIHTFSNPRLLYTPPTGQAVAYSSFFPNAAGVVFEVELSDPSGYGYTWQGNTGELWWADVASGMSHRLDSLNGYTSTGAIYLPAQAGVPDGGTPNHTPAVDVTVNYEPTVNPIASGGYAWVVFTSRRMYGNVATLPPWTSDPRGYAWRDQITDKKMWVAAIDLNAKPGTDPSHPAFYLPAQELHAGNARGYWTVEACKGNGAGCATGDQCCGGFCQPGEDGGGLQCTAQAPPCSAQYEKCTTTSDCCGAAAGIQCINGVCTLSSPK